MTPNSVSLAQRSPLNSRLAYTADIAYTLDIFTWMSNKYLLDIENLGFKMRAPVLPILNPALAQSCPSQLMADSLAIP